MTPRQIAKEQGLLTYEGQACKKGHGTTRYVSDKNCPSCRKENRKKYLIENPDKANWSWKKSVMRFPPMDFSPDNISPLN